MSLAWAEPALGDLEAIQGTFGRDSEAFASRVLDKVIGAVERIVPVPRLGRVVAELEDERIRELVFHSFRIIYRVEAKQIVVLSVLQGGRTLGDRREPRRWEIT
ncbi:MAG: type II toxin-antitoxin system RelE/ParE family toxin [Acidobacteriota bacterium]